MKLGSYFQTVPEQDDQGGRAGDDSAGNAHRQKPAAREGFL